jgi:anti-anti-sigma regulatory factor
MNRRRGTDLARRPRKSRARLRRPGTTTDPQRPADQRQTPDFDCDTPGVASLPSTVSAGQDDSLASGPPAVDGSSRSFDGRPGSKARSECPGSDSVSSLLVAIIKATGCIDAEHVAPFTAELDAAVAAGASRLLVDLSQAEEVTTAGMNALLAAREKLIQRAGLIAVVLPGCLRHRFQALHLGRRFLLPGDRSEAVELLGVTASDNRPNSHALAV